MFNFVHYIPIVTTIFSAVFAFMLLSRYREGNGKPYLLWWGIGVALYGVGTFTESYVSLIGWNEYIFRLWYISGALLGGAPLAQGTVYLLMSRTKADRLTIGLVSFIMIAAVLVIMTPLNYTLVEAHRLSGKVIEWQWVRLFSPFINLYAVIFLVGGAIYSARFYKKHQNMQHKYLANIYIAIGAILPGIGGSFTRFGYTEVLYVTELLGLSLIYLGYIKARGKKPTVLVEA